VSGPGDSRGWSAASATAGRTRLALGALGRQSLVPPRYAQAADIGNRGRPLARAGRLLTLAAIHVERQPDNQFVGALFASEAGDRACITIGIGTADGGQWPDGSTGSVGDREADSAVAEVNGQQPTHVPADGGAMVRLMRVF